jgi:uncharacterized protein with GYD domain
MVAHPGTAAAADRPLRSTPLITWNMQGANEGSANTNKWFNNVRTYARQAQIVMLQEAGPWPSESAHQVDDITRTTVNSNGNTTTQTIRQFLWSVRDGDYRNVYFVHTQNGQGGRVNLAIVTDGEPDEVNVVQNPVNAGRVALGVRFGNNWYFTVHGLSGGGGDSAVLLAAARGGLHLDGRW